MRAYGLVVRGFRNLADTALELPESGFALTGPNGHGKTNLLEALGYPVLFRSVRGAADREIGRFAGPGFQVAITTAAGSTITSTYFAAERRKRIVIDGEEQRGVSGALGRWLAVAFFPGDLELVRHGGAERRRWLDRMLALADRQYLITLLRYRGALAQRNAALRRGDIASAQAFDPPLIDAGHRIHAARRDWVGRVREAWRQELDALGEVAPVDMRYRSDDSLSDPMQWHDRLRQSRDRDLARAQTHVGPHRDDVLLTLNGHALRHYGSTGQQRSAAIALRLLEWETLAIARGVTPVLLVDDVFAELDHDRQQRLAVRIAARPGQRVVTAPREQDIPPQLGLAGWQMRDGRVERLVGVG